MINEPIGTGEKVSAVLKNATTGEKRVIDGQPKKYKVEIKVTDLATGKVIYTHEDTR